jgi:hypothetical protein
MKDDLAGNSLIREDSMRHAFVRGTSLVSSRTNQQPAPGPSTTTDNNQQPPTPNQHLRLQPTMLSKPGTARTKPSPSVRNRRKVIETPEEVLRKLQRLPANKSCADCGCKVRRIKNHQCYVKRMIYDL